MSDSPQMMGRGITWCLCLLWTVSLGCRQPAVEAPTRAKLVLRGEIRNTQGYALGNILILAIPNDGQGARSGVSDAHGAFQVHGLKPGAYTLRVLRGHEVVAESTMHLGVQGVIDHPFIVPAAYGDRPEQRGLPLVHRSLVTSD